MPWHYITYKGRHAIKHQRMLYKYIYICIYIYIIICQCANVRKCGCVDVV